MTYNAQGRMDSLTVTKYQSDGTTVDSVTSYQYEYNDSGIRVKQVVNDGTTITTTVYHVDPSNHTGYTQVLEEKDAQGNVTKTFTIGHDVLAQATAAAAQILYLLTDGHGSTRAVYDLDVLLDRIANSGNIADAIQQRYAYDAYGNLLAGTHLTDQVASALVSLLYSGEQTDLTGLQYLRARYYNPSTGGFNRLDPFFGNLDDPLSLHKYLYVHGDPITGIDPSGEFSIVSFAIAGGIIGALVGGIDAALGGGDIFDIAEGAVIGGAFGTALGALAFIFPAAFASNIAVGIGVSLGIAGAAQSFQEGKNAQGVFRVFTGIAIPLAIKNAALARFALQAKANLAKLWSAVRLRQGFQTDPTIAGSLVSQRISIANAKPGRYIYVVDEAGNMWLGSNTARHQALLPKGAGARAAGHIVIEANKSARLNSRSGTFMQEQQIRSHEEPAWLAALTETLLQAGIALEEASVTTFLR